MESFPPQTRVMVTGGSGFVGRNLISKLVLLSAEVVAIARSDSSEKAVRSAGAHHVVRGDLSNSEALKEACQNVSVVFHCAARVGTNGRWAEFLESTVEGTRRVLEAAQACGVKRFVHVSTEATIVAGSRQVINADETFPYPKHSNTFPYSKSKQMAEKIVVSANTDKFTTVVLRPRFIWGKDDTVLLSSLKKACETGDMKWFSGGTYKTSTVHVDNVVEGLILAAQHKDIKEVGGEIFFLTDGEPVVFKEFVGKMLQTNGVDTSKIGSLPFNVAWMAAAVMDTFTSEPILSRQALYLVGQEVTVNDAKARRVLNYKSTVTIDEGLADLARRYKESQGETTEKSEE